MDYRYIETALRFAAKEYGVKWVDIMDNKATTHNTAKARNLAMYGMANYVKMEILCDVIGVEKSFLHKQRYNANMWLTNDLLFWQQYATLSKLLDEIQSQQSGIIIHNAA